MQETNGTAQHQLHVSTAAASATAHHELHVSTAAASATAHHELHVLRAATNMFLRELGTCSAKQSTAHLGMLASTFSAASGVASSRPRPAAAFLGAGLGAALLAGRLGVVGLVAAGLVVVAGLVGVCSGFFTA
jgi:hypothetical protein